MDEDENECLPIPRRSLVNRFRDHIENSPNVDHRSSRFILNNSNSSDCSVDETIQTPLQLIALYEQTIECAAKNKINAKNAFHFPLVERLPEILDIIAFDDRHESFDQHHEPNFVKAGTVIDTSAKIYAYRVDALHTDTQKLNGSIQQKEEEEEESMTIPSIDQPEISHKSSYRNRPKMNSYLVTDLSTISLSYEFQFHPFQPSNMCHWPGGVGIDSLYADMVSYTMYSSSDFPLLDGFIDLNSRINHDYHSHERILDLAIRTTYDLIPLREAIKHDDGFDHFLGCSSLREFTFNEDPTESYIETIDECSIRDHSFDNDAQIFDYTCSELRDDRSNFYFQELQSAHTFPTTMASMNVTFLHNQISFVDQIPQLLHEKIDASEYSYFDLTKLKLFAGPYLWKYTNLLPIVISEQKSIHSHSRTRSHKLNLDKICSLDELMHVSSTTSHRKSKRKRLQTFPLSQINSNQLRLSRKRRPLNDLISFHYFPDYHFQFQENSSIIHDDHHSIDHDDPLPDQFEYDFIRPIHYEKIQFEKLSGKIDAKKLQNQLNDQYNEQSLSSSHQPISLSSLCVKLVDQGFISSSKDQLISTFYCLLNHCHRNHLYLKNTFQHDDLIIIEQQQQTPFV